MSQMISGSAEEIAAFAMRSSTMEQSQEVDKSAGASQAREAAQRPEMDRSLRYEAVCPYGIDSAVESCDFGSGGSQTAAAHVDLTDEPQAGEIQSQEPPTSNASSDNTQGKLPANPEAAEQTTTRLKEHARAEGITAGVESDTVAKKTAAAEERGSMIDFVGMLQRTELYPADMLQRENPKARGEQKSAGSRKTVNIDKPAHQPGRFFQYGGAQIDLPLPQKQTPEEHGDQSPGEAHEEQTAEAHEEQTANKPSEAAAEIDLADTIAKLAREKDAQAEKATDAEDNKKYFCTDARSILRGACSCGQCNCWELQHFSSIWWRDLEESKVLCQRAYLGEVCEKCGCPPTKHVDLQYWLHEIRNRMKRFRATGITTQRTLPQKSRLPIEAKKWTLDELALYTLTLGRLDPGRSLAPPSAREEEDQSPLISVCVPTSSKRHRFHPLLYKNFVRQDYKNKELVVIDTGPWPSRHLQSHAVNDDSVHYYHFPVEDAKEDKMETMRRLRMQAGYPEHLWGNRIKQGENWSLGLKRNCAVHLSHGAIICHFDDDDLYSPGYLSFMSAKLLQEISDKKGPQIAESAKCGEYPAIATLSEWHMLDMNSMTFRWLDPKKEPMPEEWRKPMIYGYGFSYVFTRASWELQAFPDTETCEDDIFMERLEKKNVSVTLVKLPSDHSGLVAHSYHSDCTSGGEFNGNKRQGYVVATPRAFEDLLPLAREISKDMPKHHPVRVIQMQADAAWQAPKGKSRGNLSPWQLQKPHNKGRGKGMGKVQGWRVSSDPGLRSRSGVAYQPQIPGNPHVMQRY
mmetsp:Transcript_147440/g.259976  ORF Transcript_147440/g.259976 Transcript_147440/m.259976 type:complete len:799 (-) Transcript_147440:50-2446(-)